MSIKTETINALLIALHNCNRADIEGSDLPNRACRSDDAYGCITDALWAIDAHKELAAYVATGDLITY